MLIMSSNVWLRSSLIFLILYFSVSRSSSIWQTIKNNSSKSGNGNLPTGKSQIGSNGHDRHLINPDVEPLDVHLSLLASVFAHLQLVPEVSRDGENTWGNKHCFNNHSCYLLIFSLYMTWTLFFTALRFFDFVIVKIVMIMVTSTRGSPPAAPPPSSSSSPHSSPRSAGL